MASEGFKRIASTLEGNEYNNSIFKLFLEPKHAKNFLSATEELKEELTKLRGQNNEETRIV